MAGIYIHIPFCRQACHYCNFHFSTSLRGINDFIAALLKEMQLRKDYLGGETVETIYFGGGTPSLLDSRALDTILSELHRHFPVDSGAEITLEANPDDLYNVFREPHRLRGNTTVEPAGQLLQSWQNAGINRLSIGVQSFFEEDLRWMNRAHSAQQALESIAAVRAVGFENISVDLIYGTPGLSDQRWRGNLRKVFELGLPHLSCYALTVEPKTALEYMIRQQKMPDTNPEDQARHFLILMDLANEAGYEHYEISNFALPGHRSRHNSSYWQGKFYLGLGPSAHSFNGTTRSWNASNNAQYVDYWLEARGSLSPPGGSETLTPAQQTNEYIMTSLRTLEGCDLAHISGRFGQAIASDLRSRAARYINTNKMVESNGRLILLPEGKLLADGIAADLFF
jgi:oxygen-independent coproporphyrinogen-3 oxidase